MLRTRSLFSLATLTLGIAIELAIAPRWSPARAQFSPPDRGAPLSADGGAARFSPPDRGAPESADGGATRRTDCIHVTPLMPSDENNAHFGLTYSARPEMYWYIGSAKAGLESASVIIERDTDDGDIETLREVDVTLPDDLSAAPRILELDWSPDEAGLEAGEDYRWYLEVQCNPARPSDPTAIASYIGWIERVEANPDLEARLSEESDDPVALARIYGEAGLWFDYMNQLVDTSGAWNYLLRGFRLLPEESEATPVAAGESGDRPVRFLRLDETASDSAARSTAGTASETAPSGE